MAFESVERKRKTHCVHGHAYNKANTITLASGVRVCRACKTANYIRYRD
jgi:hypothetical protein